MSKYQLCVIVKAPNTDGNWFDEVMEIPEGGLFSPDFRTSAPKVTHIPKGSLLSYRAKVFEAGEIFLVDENGREVGYPRRKPSKWEVEFKLFPMNKLEQAVELAQSAAWVKE